MSDAEHQEETIARQALLNPKPNPAQKRDCLSSLSGTLRVKKMETTAPEGSQMGVEHLSDARIHLVITLTYAPDRFIIEADDWHAYLQLLERATSFFTLENFADLVLDDVNNETVPRWLQVQISWIKDTETLQTVLIEDRQPNWDNAALLYRAPRL